MNMRAIRVEELGAADVLVERPVAVPEPGPGEALIRLESVGVNFIDIYHRTGVYKVPLPFTPGQEGAGLVEKVGEGVQQYKSGDRVAWAMQMGSYAEYAVVPAWKLVRLPVGIPMDVAAATMLQGMTAHYLTHDTFRLAPGHVALVQAAAGATGQLILQIGKLCGARMIASVGSPEKEEIARASGADDVIIYKNENWPQQVKNMTGGAGVDVVYDSVGQATVQGSMACLRPRGYLALFGQASGVVAPLDPAHLASGGSLYLTRPILSHYATTAAEIEGRTRELFGWVERGQLKITIDRIFPLSAAASAHRHLESRQAKGKILLHP